MTKSIVINKSDLAKDDEKLRTAQRERFERMTERTLLEGTPRNTARAYRNDFRQFENWCAAQQPPFSPLPTEETALLGYLTDLDTKGPSGKYPCRSGTIERRLSGIVWAHAVMNIPSPVTPRLSKLLHAIKVRRVREGEEPPRMAAPLTLADLRKIAKWCDGNQSPLTIRNRALVLVGWVCAMRRSEIAELERDDIGKFTSQGFMLTIRKSKADQLGAGRDLPVTSEEDRLLCPVEAMRAWLEIRGDTPGPLFWGHGWQKHRRALGEKQVSRVVVGLVKKAGLRPEGKNMDFSAHSLRAGFITEAVRAGQHDRQVMERSRHKTHEVFLRYVRIAQTVDKNAATGFSRWDSEP